MIRRMLIAATACTLVLAACATNPAGPKSVTLNAPPAAEKRPVTDTYHGVSVSEDYRWLEDWNDPAVKAWSEGQNGYARSVLDNLPSLEAVRKRVTTLLTGSSVAYHGLQERGQKLFALKVDPRKQQPMLVVMPSPDRPDQERLIVDPNALDAKGLTAIDWFVASPDGSMVAVSMSEGGSESGTVFIYNTSTATRTSDVIPRAHGGTAGGSLAWAADGKSFYYTRYPRQGERAAEEMDFWVQVYSHVLGTPTGDDRYEVGKDFPKIAEVVIDATKDGRNVLVSVQKGDGGEFFHCLKSGDTWKQVTKYEDRVVMGALGNDGFAYLVSSKDAPRGKVLKLALADADLAKAREIVAQHPSYSIETDFFARKGVTVIGPRLLVQYQAGGPSELGVFDTEGRSGSMAALPPICSVDEIAEFNGEPLLNIETFLKPPAWMTLPPRGEMQATKLVVTSAANYSDCDVVREYAVSKDGTRIPVNIIRRKGVKLDGNNPTIIWGYGGYGVCEAPVFSPRRRVFIEQGGVFAVANIRGGGEYGEEWHTGGNLTRKQNCFDDFYAASKLLIDRGYTRREKLALMGGSNGGLLMGALMTQHPDLCRAIVSSVGIYDMLRVELSANGAFNVTEFGTVQDKDQFTALYGYSPLHHVADGTQYPNVLFLTGANDPRVDPMQSRKMTARLQAASPGSQTLLRTSASSGHGVGSSLAQRIEETVDTYAWLFEQLGVTYKPVAR